MYLCGVTMPSPKPCLCWSAGTKSGLVSSWLKAGLVPSGFKAGLEPSGLNAGLDPSGVNSGLNPSGLNSGLASPPSLIDGLELGSDLACLLTKSICYGGLGPRS